VQFDLPWFCFDMLTVLFRLAWFNCLTNETPVLTLAVRWMQIRWSQSVNEIDEMISIP